MPSTLSHDSSRPRRAAAGLLALWALATLAGCATNARPAVRLAPHTKLVRLQAKLTAEQIQQIDDNCGPFGVPKADKDWPFGPTDLVVREGYVLQHSALDKIPLWVCEHVTPEELAGNLPRRNPFAPDPQLAGKPRADSPTTSARGSTAATRRRPATRARRSA